jgi:hypothetical protein
MPEPKIVTTKMTRREPAPDRRGVPAPARGPEASARRSRPEEPAIHPRRDEPRRKPRRGLHPALFGLLLVAGGVAVWGSIRPERSEVPDVWNETTGPDGPAARMVAQVKPSGPAKLLRLEWPAHPRADSYRIRFLDERGVGPAPVPVQSTVFLYDMETNVLHLPGRFDWEVTAILPDGSEVLTPTRHYPE